MRRSSKEGVEIHQGMGLDMPHLRKMSDLTWGTGCGILIFMVEDIPGSLPTASAEFPPFAALAQRSKVA